MIGIIYKYTNTVNNKIYIGQTIYEDKRINQHKQCYGKCIFHNAIKKYGWDSFKYEVIYRTNEIEDSKLLENTLNEKEIYYINYYDSYNNGYNMTKGGGRFFRFGVY